MDIFPPELWAGRKVDIKWMVDMLVVITMAYIEDSDFQVLVCSECMLEVKLPSWPSWPLKCF